MPPEACARLDRMAAACPLYKSLIGKEPGIWLWLEVPENREALFRHSNLELIWEDKYHPGGKEAALPLKLAALRRFRRRISIHVAYREINDLAPLEDGLGELTALAEFCLRKVCEWTFQNLSERLGTPWSHIADRPAAYCVLGMGKLGGGELNFCSDLDLIFFHEDDGPCRKNGRATQIDSGEFFSRFVRQVSSCLTERTADGFLYNIDLRLRPEGETGPLSRSLTSMENYYSAAGQTWERLAMIKARAVAGNEALGSELFESLHPFRYPRHVPQTILEQVAGVKLRIEKEVLGKKDYQSNIKNGFGGIREIEFFVQALQLVNAAKIPFLQTHQTLEGLDKLMLYKLATPDDAESLADAYRLLRLVENRLQMREEGQTHDLPDDEAERETLAASFGYDGWPVLERKINAARIRVNAIYAQLFSELGDEEEILDWSSFLSGKPPAPAIEKQLVQWFGPKDATDAPQTFRTFIRGGPHNLLTREQTLLFLEVTRHFDKILPPLAHPQRTLQRLARFAERYGARTQLLKACAANRRFFLSICLLFDRSQFIHELLCQHPEIMDEVLLSVVARLKTAPEYAQELAHLPQDRGEFCNWLWLYVKAEQVRLATAEVLTDFTREQLEQNLTLLADAALGAAMRRADPDGELALIALGKYGGGELTFGSDLDLLIIGPQDNIAEQTAKVHHFTKIVTHQGSLGRTFEVDLRLRPHGKDGPLVSTMNALRLYHAPGGPAKFWEKQMLTRARPVLPLRPGSPRYVSIKEFVPWRKELLYSRGITGEEIQSMREMRERISREKARTNPQERAYKAAPGGLVDIEFLCQKIQLEHGHHMPHLQLGNTRALLWALRADAVIPKSQANTLLANYEFLRNIELHLRRENNRSVDELSDDPDQQRSITKWMRFETYDTFFKEHTRRMAQTREICARLM